MSVLGTAQGPAAALELEKGRQPPEAHFARGSQPVEAHSCMTMCYTPQRPFHAGRHGADPRPQSRVVFAGCPLWGLMHGRCWEGDCRAEEQLLPAGPSARKEKKSLSF